MPIVALAALLLLDAAGIPDPVPTTAPELAATAPSPPGFGPEWKTLLGEWKGAGSGSPGQGGGTASFRFDLESRILVRRSSSDYPAAEGRPAVHHEDLMIVYPGASPEKARAAYFDNEGHVIEYQASWSANGKTLTFVSSASPSGPRFRLVYKVLASDRLAVDFDIAPPGTETFRTYVAGTLERVRP